MRPAHDLPQYLSTVKGNCKDLLNKIDAGGPWCALQQIK